MKRGDISQSSGCHRVRKHPDLSGASDPIYRSARPLASKLRVSATKLVRNCRHDDNEAAAQAAYLDANSYLADEMMPKL